MATAMAVAGETRRRRMRSQPGKPVEGDDGWIGMLFDVEGGEAAVCGDGGPGISESGDRWE